MRPIGSVAKAMTALVVLTVHPLNPAASGPSIAMTNADVARYREALAAGGSNLRVRAGEILTERDLLLALLLPSADNIAETLAVWVSGSRSTFIARLNATATAMGMYHTHFADPSGLSVRTVSTALDLVTLAKAVIANPALTQLVGTAQASLPDGTVLKNLDVVLNRQAGWLGIKTGWNGRRRLFLFAEHALPPGTPSVWGGAPASLRTARAMAHIPSRSGISLGEHAASAAVAAYTAADLSAVAPRCPDRSRRAGDPARLRRFPPSRLLTWSSSAREP